MTLKSYKACRLAVAMVLAFGISTLVTTGNYLLPIIAALLGWIILYNLRQHVDGILADERDYSLAGQSARYTLSAVSVIMMVGFFLLMHFSKQKPELYSFAILLSYLVIAMLLLNAAIFQYLRMKAQIDKPGFRSWLKAFGPYLIIAFFLSFIFAAGSLRLFTGEDDWICKNGSWVEHGHPANPKPTVACPK
ncbi:MAG: DUF2178 domain-containing protein [Bacillota bacterium]